jgi:haloacetate dehalogenase
VFEGFKQIQVQTSDPEVKINLRYGGNGPPILLIHGNPLTHVHWHLVAPRLAKDFTVVCTDLRGYGDSGKPRGLADHSNYSFRRMAQDNVEVMQHLGFSEFCVAGHDRGGRQGEEARHLRHFAHASHTDACQLAVGREFLPLVFHGAAL